MENLIKKHQIELERIFKKEEVILAYLFGSAARKKVGPLSDIDIAVLFSEKVKKDDYFDKRLKLAEGSQGFHIPKTSDLIFQVDLFS